MAKHLVGSMAIHGASIIGQPGGWSVLLKLGLTERALSAQRTGKPRTWKSLDRCVDYLKKELHLERFELLDATNYSDIDLAGNSRNDASARMKLTHQAAAYDKWFRAEVQQGLREADAPDTQWVSNEKVMAESAERREIWRQRANAQLPNRGDT